MGVNSVQNGIKTEMTIDGNGGYIVTAKISEWDLMQTIPGQITRAIVEAIASRFILAHGEVIMKSLMKPEFIAKELPKAVERHIQEYFSKQDKKDK